MNNHNPSTGIFTLSGAPHVRLSSHLDFLPISLFRACYSPSDIASVCHHPKIIQMALTKVLFSLLKSWLIGKCMTQPLGDMMHIASAGSPPSQVGNHVGRKNTRLLNATSPLPGHIWCGDECLSVIQLKRD